MIIGFLGKGGSGKSTLTTAMTKHLVETGNKVLAVDADHNMDLMFNLGVNEQMPYLGNAMEDIRAHVGLTGERRFANFFLDGNEADFRLMPADEFTSKYTVQLSDKLSAMAAGPYTDDVLYGQHCSHELSSVLRLYLPLLKLQENEWVVVDEKAGRDGAGTGIPTGYNYTIVVVDPTTHGAKAAAQIAELLEFFGCEYDFALNKTLPETDASELGKLLPKPIKYQFPFWQGQDIPEVAKTELDKIVATANDLVSAHGDRRYELTVRKFEDRKQYVADVA